MRASDKIVKIGGVPMRDTNPAPDTIYMPNELLSEEWQRHIEGQDTAYINKSSLVAFIEDAIAENMEYTTPDNYESHEGYHKACWDIMYFINQMGK